MSPIVLRSYFNFLVVDVSGGTGHPTFLWKRHITFLKSILLLITLNVNILTL